ncbi:hypothetical protein ASPWEDRAFT_36715 [Aspergillus wentii DTO 134E9]|uniref:Protein-lysine N-methyltransferase EFM4 n=1 Tax=Aspergillus wentii DTO 134E9 TaxID=1073089 RepID=A0A1L9RVQ7_ASPWE|nr:uncharacterized protein ASPWEDRAFT_36715 [Aspergillus wentii DTO 134E9]KAI9929290.1 hypothetical protein MW887_001698 [Aspergillus wentii]OJJ39005.1 hypothetical protein ASPWEDRAFT_36715 [Aspergillus wentii DTO 134E9]
MASEDSHPTHLPPSELGTKDYWETYYARTLSHISSKQKPSIPSTQTHREPARDRDEGSDSDSHSDEDSDDEVDDDDDPGTSWFSEHNAPDKVLRFLTSEEFPLAPCNTTTTATATATATNNQPSILDLGTGNGSMLALLRKRGKFGGVMVGVDYSGQSVELARELQRLRIHSAYLSDSEDEDDEGEGGDENEEGKSGDSDTNIRFEEWDILGSGHVLSESAGSGSASEGPRLDWFPYEQGGFDIVLDKGTFDAVSLSDEVETAATDEGKKGSKVIQRRVCERYPDIARRLVRKGGFLVVTSCNWTEEELIKWFTGEGEKKDSEDRLSVWGRVEYPRFRFGGMEGQGVCTVCFERR